MQHLQPIVIFQQDGALFHWSMDVRAFLDATFPYRWIGHGSPIAWPPISPDISPLDFFFWGYIKDKVYSREIHDVEDLRASITAAIATVTTEM
ncbi:hypothetical protein AVEN_1097-1 [Araneus ventricosus]|uniref:Tc1-like transposase DDE domain-containing protein n=1 Tax=Araneus ventricosus TaxID=182803 RepID=A0A4Y2N1N1_ARAVE|nr:hypothetical protein AVEN_1097-1 [Araneus ventricosus]